MSSSLGTIDFNYIWDTYFFMLGSKQTKESAYNDNEIQLIHNPNFLFRLVHPIELRILA